MGGTFASCQTQRDLCWVVLKNFLIFEGSALIKKIDVWGFYDVFWVKIFDPEITIFHILVMIYFLLLFFIKNS